MKTDDLIAAMARDGMVEPGSGKTMAWIVPLSVAAVAAVFFGTLGLRPDEASAQTATFMKLAITLPLAVSGLWAVHRAQQGHGSAHAWRVLFAAGFLLVAFCLVDLIQNGTSGAFTRMIGSKGLHCMTLIPLFSLLPLGAFLFALRRGTVFAPRFAGIATGFASSGIGATFYALNCMEDSPLFLLLWYSLAVAIVSVIAIAFSKKLLRW